MLGKRTTLWKGLFNSMVAANLSKVSDMQLRRRESCAKFSAIYFAKNFNPAIDAMSVVRKNNRQKSAGSRKKIIPAITVPAAPMPVHTA